MLTSSLSLSLSFSQMDLFSLTHSHTHTHTHTHTHARRGARIAQRLERWTRDRKIPGSSHTFFLFFSGRSGGRIFFSRVNFLCWLSYFGSHVTPVALEKSRSFSYDYIEAESKCRWQVTSKRTLHMWLWMKWHCALMHGWMVYAELAPRRQQFHVTPVMQQPKNAISTQLSWRLKKIRAMKGHSHLFIIICDMCAVSLFESRE